MAKPKPEQDVGQRRAADAEVKEEQSVGDAERSDPDEGDLDGSGWREEQRPPGSGAGDNGDWVGAAAEDPPAEGQVRGPTEHAGEHQSVAEQRTARAAARVVAGQDDDHDPEEGAERTEQPPPPRPLAQDEHGDERDRDRRSSIQDERRVGGAGEEDAEVIEDEKQGHAGDAEERRIPPRRRWAGRPPRQGQEHRQRDDTAREGERQGRKSVQRRHAGDDGGAPHQVRHDDCRRRASTNGPDPAHALAHVMVHHPRSFAESRLQSRVRPGSDQVAVLGDLPRIDPFEKARLVVVRNGVTAAPGFIPLDGEEHIDERFGEE